MTPDPDVVGLTMNHSMPALVEPARLNPVSRAPHSFPLAKVTCIIRLSPESGVEITSLCAGSATNKNCQHPGPNGVGMVVSLMHWPSGKSPAFWFDLGGTLYDPTGRVVCDSERAGVAVIAP